MKEKYIPGEGCQCSARCSCECGCDVDWTPREVRKLERELDEAREYADRLAEGLPEGMLPKDVEVLREANLNLATELTAITEQRDRLAEALRELCETLLKDKPRDITESLYKAGDALAAVKGGSNDKQPTKDETEDGSPKVGTPPRRRERRER